MEVDRVFSPEVLDLFASMLSRLTLDVGAADFEEAARVVLLARSELAAARTPDFASD